MTNILISTLLKTYIYILMQAFERQVVCAVMGLGLDTPVGDMSAIAASLWRRLSKHALVQTVRQRWKIDFYHQMRQQEVCR